MKNLLVILIFIVQPLFAQENMKLIHLKAYFDSPDDFYSLNLSGNQSANNLFHYYKYRDQIRSRIMPSPTGGIKSIPSRKDLVQNLFPTQQIEYNILKLKSSAIVSKRPWSDDYWPIYKGILGSRYADEEFIDLFDWEETFQFYSSNPIPSKMTEKEVNLLSPAEKYDLIIGENYLTKSQWAVGQKYYTARGEVEQWMGICHGWSPGSIMVDRPQNQITVPSYDQKYNITFYPSDIKALVSLLWANTKYKNHFIGGRCRDVNPRRDDNDRVLKPDCLDSNPASFHLALTNGIGRFDTSFVMDATFDYEVWNQPLISYKLDYFKVTKQEDLLELEEALIDVNDYPQDRFKKFRHPKTRYIVGVALEVKYAAEAPPIQRSYDSEKFDQDHTVFYYYDLELDQNYNIIGGEWYNFQHPDFLWRPARSADALSNYDYYLLSSPLWDGHKPIPKGISDLAKKSANQSTPLAYIVKSLVKLSNSKTGENK